jgi:hypothetical protein
MGLANFPLKLDAMKFARVDFTGSSEGYESFPCTRTTENHIHEIAAEARGGARQSRAPSNGGRTYDYHCPPRAFLSSRQLRRQHRMSASHLRVATYRSDCKRKYEYTKTVPSGVANTDETSGSTPAGSAGANSRTSSRLPEAQSIL